MENLARVQVLSWRLIMESKGGLKMEFFDMNFVRGFI